MTLDFKNRLLWPIRLFRPPTRKRTHLPLCWQSRPGLADESRGYSGEWVALTANALSPTDRDWRLSKKRRKLQEFRDPSSAACPTTICRSAAGSRPNDLSQVTAGALVVRRNSQFDSKLWIKIKLTITSNRRLPKTERNCWREEPLVLSFEADFTRFCRYGKIACAVENPGRYSGPVCILSFPRKSAGSS